MEFDRPHHHHRTAITTPTSTTTSTTTTQSGEQQLFICFTSRLSSSSSSMKIAKSILSPGRARGDPPISLSTSLSRRLRTNGSIKGAGQASPMFPPTNGKKRGCAFENPEPSSPKVTCIGQVRVKTKKKVKQTRSLSRRRSGEVSFRKVDQQISSSSSSSSHHHDLLKNNNEESVVSSSSAHFQQQQEYLQQQHRNQRWVHLPVTICEALRAFGAEFSCLFPCKSSCFSTNEKEEKANYREEEGGNNNEQSSSCGAVFARWFVALQDCEGGGKGREIELVVGGDEEKTEVGEERISMRRSSRRHVFEDLEFKEETIDVKGGEEDEEKARVSICIPPKNALLLMRCRSDPMKMAALNNRFWESPAPKHEDQDHDDEEEEEEENINVEEDKELEEELVHVPEIVNEAGGLNVEEEGDEVVIEQFVSAESNGETAEKGEKDANLANEVQEYLVQEEEEEEPEEKLLGEQVEESEKMESLVESSEDAESGLHSSENHLLDQELMVVENKEENPIQEHEEEEKEEEIFPTDDNSLSSSENYSEAEQVLAEEEEAALEEENQENVEKSTLEEIQEETSLEENEENLTATLFTAQLQSTENDNEEEKEVEQIEESNGQESQEVFQENEVKGENVLPDCLLLMMCEPKLSMEVSKETWVCRTDFLRWLPERPPAVKKKVKVNNSDETSKNEKKKVSTAYGPLPPPQEIITQQHQKEKEKEDEVILPARSSCSLPAAAAVSMAAMIEQKLVNAVAYEPFVLTRCKSEPMRTAAAKLLPEACFWKNRKLEPHRNAAFGVGAAGVGF
ncbi:hypothetical protein ACH5RR_028116 [Cinchona calisaya]|uniref:Uncharacterized protein n=1 Tax=Cinchona calisaya TaxID=153742 RepID=A0ABD2YMU1_9GENT